MARLPRLAIDRQLHHLRHEAAPGRMIFGDAAVQKAFLEILFEVSRASAVAIHAYVLLPQRVQLLLTPSRGSDLAPMMQRLGRRFAGDFNQRQGASGSPWAGRYRTGILQPSLYLLEAMRLVESQPVLHGLVARPEDWPASSASHHAGLRSDRLITDHPEFWVLGNTPFERELAYRRFCERTPPDGLALRIDDATTKGWVIGDTGFIDGLSAQQARRLLPDKPGRPKRLDGRPVSDPN